MNGFFRPEALEIGLFYFDVWRLQLRGMRPTKD
jgi:hypothetical protein